MSGKKPPARRAFPLFLLIILIALILSFTALYQAMNAYLNNEFAQGNYLLLMGVMMLALSAFALFQTRRGIPRLTLEAQRVATTILCRKCGFKNVREFQRGDYIFREMETCPKCNETTMIASIYREVKEKEEV